MSKLDRIQDLHHLLAGRHTPIRLTDVMAHLECSESTARRTIDALRDQFAAPLVYDRKANGWRYDRRDGERPFELPGLWFDAAELYALLAAHELLSDVPPGLLADDIGPLAARIQHILAKRGLPPAQRGRIGLRATGTRQVQQPAFGVVCEAVLTSRRLGFTYRPRGQGQPRGRFVSPQRLTWYRGNWYLEAWCHEADAMRRFAVERIDRPSIGAEPIYTVASAKLDAWAGSAYGIFAGAPTATAILRFTAERARWIADEQWHPSQQTRWLEDGHYELSIPYADPRELLMDILSYGPDVEVIAPEELQRKSATD